MIVQEGVLPVGRVTTARGKQAGRKAPVIPHAADPMLPFSSAARSQVHAGREHGSSVLPYLPFAFGDPGPRFVDSPYFPMQKVEKRVEAYVNRGAVTCFNSGDILEA